ncbi:Transcriptional regulator, contains XRE-family HTH domain [Thermanaeromonas toyohensis ToBE]|uniref:Transcriptional regulator, contains XRE-family HTH domain n=1 Tax=Thermanaeromonas toyohensis ToBE TaxID=698762 RepID=A0A1W1VX11_9FIRM|nr:helix-turn-helix transcriptional regulator [Thermanaeromonas toyohensis]SMB97866.1 Transcriptional regulator, contains XRE-family HTH domain [Thermanaeromonas toyohensis ToBE]
MIGKRLRFYRQKKRLTLKDVEEITGLHATTISGYERGIREPSYKVLRTLAKVYDIPVAYLLLEEEEIMEVIPSEIKELVALIEKRPEIGEFIEEIKNYPQSLVRELRHVLQRIRRLSLPK